MGAQWLLIGGVAHGQTMWVKCGTSVLFSGEDGKMHQYVGHQYVSNGRLYQIGVFDVRDVVPSVVEVLIHKTNLKPIENDSKTAY